MVTKENRQISFDYNLRSSDGIGEERTRERRTKKYKEICHFYPPSQSEEQAVDLLGGDDVVNIDDPPTKVSDFINTEAVEIRYIHTNICMKLCDLHIETFFNSQCSFQEQ